MVEKPNVTPNHAGTQEGQGKDEAEVARLTDGLATGATGDSTRREYNGRVRTSANIRAARGKGPWLLEKKGWCRRSGLRADNIHVLSMSRIYW